jgi:hypothetical protein
VRAAAIKNPSSEFPEMAMITEKLIELRVGRKFQINFLSRNVAS